MIEFFKLLQNWVYTNGSATGCIIGMLVVGGLSFIVYYNSGVMVEHINLNSSCLSIKLKSMVALYRLQNTQRACPRSVEK